MKMIFKFVLLVGIITGTSLFASWPKSCGHIGQKTCLATQHPTHSGCKSGLKECDLAGQKRNICIKKTDKCSKVKCKNCGNNEQKPCLFDTNCHMCKKGYHVKLHTGKCTKTVNPSDELLHILKKIDKDLAKYEKNCIKFSEHLEKKLSHKTQKEIKKIINSNKKEQHILNKANHVAGYETSCVKGNFNGFACGILPWLRSYDEILITLVDTTHERNVKKHSKAFKDFSNKFLKYFLHNKKCRKTHDPVARFAYAMVLTLDHYGKDIKSCSKSVFIDVQKEIKKKHIKLKSPSPKKIKRFIKDSCYDLGSSEFNFMADQALAVITAGTGEAIELPKDVKNFINLIKKIANAKLKLENAITKSGEYFNDSHIKYFMEKHKRCRPLLKFVK